MASEPFHSVECVLSCIQHILHSELVFQPKTCALSPAMLEALLQPHLLTMEFCWHSLRIQNYRVSSCCTLALLHHTSSCAFDKFHSLFLFGSQIAVSCPTSSARIADQAYLGL